MTANIPGARCHLHNLISSSQKYHEAGTMIIPILQMRMLFQRPRSHSKRVAEPGFRPICLHSHTPLSTWCLLGEWSRIHIHLLVLLGAQHRIQNSLPPCAEQHPGWLKATGGLVRVVSVARIRGGLGAVVKSGKLRPGLGDVVRAGPWGKECQPRVMTARGCILVPYPRCF